MPSLKRRQVEGPPEVGGRFDQQGFQPEEIKQSQRRYTVDLSSRMASTGGSQRTAKDLREYRVAVDGSTDASTGLTADV